MEQNLKYIHKPAVHNLNSPDKVVPILLELFKPESVLDVGCGIGTWLNTFYRNGVKDITGIDGDFVDRNLLEQYIEIKNFKPADLDFPFDLGRKFDLVLSLEVAEHLPEISADGFIRSLCQHSDLIVFSAALPGQGGQNHINEQWKKYWIQKFDFLGYKAFDLIRPKIWNMPEVDWWYKQNMIVFSNKEISRSNDKDSDILDIIHPELFQQNLDYIIYLQQYVQELENR